MQETLHSIANTNNPFPISPKPHHFPSLSRSRKLHFPTLSSKTNTLSLPPTKLLKPLEIPSNSQSPLHLPPNTRNVFEEKMFYLESIGLDSHSIIIEHPQIVSASHSDIESTVDYVTSMGFTAPEFRRICGMCPELLTSKVSEIAPVFTFLLREAGVKSANIRRVINRRPRLLASSVENRLRPTLYFLQSIGISEVNRHTYLLSCSVEEKLIPRIDYLEKIGFSHREALAMARRFPQLFCFSIKGNFEPKFDYFVVEMGRELKELKEFPQYFSFSLENRIKPRHQCCMEKGVCFPLRVMLKTNEAEFRNRLEV